jgi:hypothetical protein
MSVSNENAIKIKNVKTKKTSTGCLKGAGSLFLCLRATGETKKMGDNIVALPEKQDDQNATASSKKK